MKHNYKVSGMSCDGCKTNVEGALGKLAEVENAAVDLPGGQVSIEMTSHIPMEKLQKTLVDAGLHYTIGEGAT